jgi:hypothetical protein
MAKITNLPERKAKKDVPQVGERFMFTHEYYVMRKGESQCGKSLFRRIL